MFLSTISSGIVLTLVTVIPAFGAWKKIAVYESFIEGARGGLDVAYKLVPYLVGMIVAVGMLRDSGVIDIITYNIGGFIEGLGYPKELIPISLLRPFSGSAANAMMFDLINQYGPDSFIALSAATIMASTETTFYMAAVYFGSVGVSKVRHSVVSSLIGEFFGMVTSVIVCRWLMS